MKDDDANRIDAFLARTGWEQARRSVIAGDASNRRYLRLMMGDGRRAILMDAPSGPGNDTGPFIAIAEHLSSHGLSAPAILADAPEQGLLLLEDLGDALFAREMNADPARQEPLYRAATDLLVALHALPVPDVPPCDADWLIEMTAPAFEWYAPSLEAKTDFEAAFAPMARRLAAKGKVLILRDYHAENLLWLPERDGVARVGLLDFQDALRGHPAYDLVSILQDARRDVPTAIETQMIARYTEHTSRDTTDFARDYALLGMQRNLRILGLFVRLCQRDGKPQYIDMIPRVWSYLQRNLDHPDLAELKRILRPALPDPTPERLESLKSRCATLPTL